MSESKSMFIVCDNLNQMVQIDQVLVFDRRVVLCAMFFTEEDALNFLFSVEEKCNIKGLMIKKISSSLTVEHL